MERFVDLARDGGLSGPGAAGYADDEGLHGEQTGLMR
jgi:hypothetical protein